MTGTATGVAWILDRDGDVWALHSATEEGQPLYLGVGISGPNDPQTLPRVIDRYGAVQYGPEVLLLPDVQVETADDVSGPKVFRLGFVVDRHVFTDPPVRDAWLRSMVRRVEVNLRRAIDGPPPEGS